MYQAALKLKRSQCNILLSGTIMQNHVGELWSLCNICKKGKDWCDFKEFQAYYTNPITISMNSDATREEIELGDERKDELYRFLSGFHIRRDKSELPESVQMKGKDSLTHLLAYLLTHSLAYSLANSLAYSPTHSLTHSLTYSRTYSLTHWLTYSLTYSLTQERMIS